MSDTDYTYCSKDDCGGKVVLASEYIQTVVPDQEPYKADEIIDIPPVAVDTYVNCHVCEKCGSVQDSWFDDYSPQPQVVNELIEALIEARKAIELLPDDSLGLGSLTDANGEEQFYPLKHELIQNIEEALKKAGANCNEKAE